MKEVNNILVTVDFSDFSDKVIEKGIELAKSFGATLFLTHIAAQKNEIIKNDTGYENIMSLEGTKLDKKVQLFKKYKPILDDSGVKCEYVLKQGEPVPQLLETAKEKNADLIVLGLVGHSALYKILIGSTAKEILSKTRVPLFLVPKVK